jgi:O-antigen/teichoic acid export membrane protein
MNWGQRGLATAVSLVIATIVGPEAYGVVAMALIYIAFMQLWLEQGISTAIIQRADLEQEHLDSAFWLNLAWCVLLAGISVVMSGWWAKVNHVDQLQPVIDVLSIWLILQGLTIVQQSILQRELKFKKLALRSNLAAIFGAAAGIVLALKGFGVWAIVGQQLTASTVSLVLLWTVGHWVPRLRFSFSHARQLLGFSSQVFAGNLGVFVNRRVDALMLGIFFGPVSVGLYRLADRLIESVLALAARPVQLFSLPEFSRHQGSPEALRRSVYSCMWTTMLTTIPVMLVIAACSKFIVDALGSKWSAASGALQLLALVGISKALMLFTAPLLFAVAKPHLRVFMVWLFAAVSTVTFVVVALLLRGTSTHSQVFGMAGSRAVLFVLVFIPVNLLLIARVADMPMRRLLPGLRSPLLSGAAGAVAVLALRATGVLDGVAPFVGLAATLPLAIATSAATLLVLEPRVRAKTTGGLRALRLRVASQGSA